MLPIANGNGRHSCYMNFIDKQMRFVRLGNYYIMND